MSSAFNEENGPQPPKVLKAPVEIIATLRQLQQNHDPLVIQFKDRSQQFQSYLVEIDRERNRVALDEITPNDGERFLRQGEAFSVEAYREGVRVAWSCEHDVQLGEFEGAPCYWAPLPQEVIYHQRRSAYRAPLKQSDLIKVVLAGDKLREPLPGQLLDISATGCKLRFAGDLSQQLQAHLQAAGATLEDVVELQSYHLARDHAEFRARMATVLKVHAEFFHDRYPAWTAVGTTALYSEGAPMEIRAEAIVGSGRTAKVAIPPPADD